MAGCNRCRQTSALLLAWCRWSHHFPAPVSLQLFAAAWAARVFAKAARVATAPVGMDDITRHIPKVTLPAQAHTQRQQPGTS